MANIICNDCKGAGVQLQLKALDLVSGLPDATVIISDKCSSCGGKGTTGKT